MQDNKILWGIITTVLVIVFIYSLFFSRPTFIVTFDSNGGTAVNSQDVLKNDLIEEPIEPIKEGYIFEAWMLDEETFDISSVTIQGDITLVASWEPIIYTISFDSNGGNELDDIEIAHGEIAERPDNPRRSGRRFLYWHQDGERFDFDTPITEDINLRARWERR